MKKVYEWKKAYEWKTENNIEWKTPFKCFLTKRKESAPNQIIK